MSFSYAIWVLEGLKGYEISWCHKLWKKTLIWVVFFWVFIGSSSLPCAVWQIYVFLHVTESIFFEFSKKKKKTPFYCTLSDFFFGLWMIDTKQCFLQLQFLTLRIQLWMPPRLACMGMCLAVMFSFVNELKFLVTRDGNSVVMLVHFELLWLHLQ